MTTKVTLVYKDLCYLPSIWKTDMMMLWLWKVTWLPSLTAGWSNRYGLHTYCFNSIQYNYMNLHISKKLQLWFSHTSCTFHQVKDMFSSCIRHFPIKVCNDIGCVINLLRCGTYKSSFWSYLLRFLVYLLCVLQLFPLLCPLLSQCSQHPILLPTDQ